jgi:hypothetical protein
LQTFFELIIEFEIVFDLVNFYYSLSSEIS